MRTAASGPEWSVQTQHFSEPPSRARTVLVHFAIFVSCAAGALGLFVCYQHFRDSGQTGLSTGCVIAAALLALVPLRALLREIFGIEGKVAHLMHGLGGLALVALPVSGAGDGHPDADACGDGTVCDHGRRAGDHAPE